MKKFILFIALSASFLSFAQLNRVEINGKIIVENDDLEGITIQNVQSKQGAVTDKNGNFSIAVKTNDVLQIRSLQYQDFDIKINETIMASQRLNIFLIQQVNQLDEIIISNKKVTGELSTDINNVKTFTPKLDVIYYGVKQERQLNESPSDMLRDDKIIANVTSQNKRLVNGLNLVNVVDQLLLPLFRSEVKDKKKAGVPDVPSDKIKYYMGSEFLTENFDIPQHRVEEFIRYVERQGFDFTLLNYGRELEFLELLNQESISFLKKKLPVKD